jgi:AhpD family alkylhydroperoxidase
MSWYIRVYMINACRYCLQHHLASSKRVGISPQEWAKLSAGVYSSIAPQEQAALQFAEKLTRESRNIGDGDIAALKEHFTEEQIVDLDLLIGLVNLTNRLTDPLGAELETPEEKIPS